MPKRRAEGAVKAVSEFFVLAENINEEIII